MSRGHRNPEIPTEGQESGLLARWSHRKQEAEAQRPLAKYSQDRVEQEAQAVPAEYSVEELTDADMQPLETLGEGSDYRAFLSPKVSESLRKAALRTLFRQSSFNVTDGLDDYAEDFTKFEPLGALVTHEMQRMLERGRRALEEAAQPPGMEPADAQQGSPEVEKPVPGEEGAMADEAEETEKSKTVD